VPDLALGWRAMAGLMTASLVLLSGTGYALWRVTRFN
jgi:hypothetical protein